MAKNSHSEFFLTIFPKKMGKNSQWLKIEFFCNNFSKKDGDKFGMAKNSHSKFFRQFFPKRWGKIQNGQK